MFLCHFSPRKSNQNCPLMAKFLKILPSRGGSCHPKSPKVDFLKFLSQSPSFARSIKLLDVDEIAIYFHKRNVGANQTNRNALDTKQPSRITLVGKSNINLTIIWAGILCSTHLKQAGHIIYFGFIASLCEANHKSR